VRFLPMHDKRVKERLCLDAAKIAAIRRFRAWCAALAVVSVVAAICSELGVPRYAIGALQFVCLILAAFFFRYVRSWCRYTLRSVVATARRRALTRDSRLILAELAGNMLYLSLTADPHALPWIWLTAVLPLLVVPWLVGLKFEGM
jgi:hypothetical protein